MALVSFATLVVPMQLATVLLMAVAMIAWTASRLPVVPNHTLLAALVGLCLWLGYLSLAGRRRRLHIPWTAIYETCRPGLKWLVVLVYFYAILHKLNSDYFDPAMSCAIDFFHAESFFLGSMKLREGVPPSALYDWIVGTPWVSYALIVGTLVAEGAITFLLTRRRWWRLGVLAGIAFHTAIGVRFLHSFGMLMFALYVPFLPNNFWVEAKTALAKILRTSETQTLATLYILILTSSLASLYVNWLGSDYNLWLIYPVLIVAVVALSFSWQDEWDEEPAMMFQLDSARLPVLIPAALVLFIGLTPYLGLGTRNTFSMFSNLRTEGAESNHFFMPATLLRIADYQEQLVEITGAANIQPINPPFSIVPYFELVAGTERQLAMLDPGVPEVAIRFRRLFGDGAEETVNLRTTALPENGNTSPLLRKLMHFRPVSNVCNW